MIKKIKCWIKAIPFWIKTGEWIPHMYSSDYEKATIIATDTSFRVSDNYEHEPGETVYKDACLIKYRCIHCGHEITSWYSSWEERWRLEE